MQYKKHNDVCSEYEEQKFIDHDDGDDDSKATRSMI